MKVKPSSSIEVLNCSKMSLSIFNPVYRSVDL